MATSSRPRSGVGMKVVQWFNTPLNPNTGAPTEEPIDFTNASTFWIYGSRYNGKSTINEIVATKFIDNGATAFDLFCSRDNESVAWLRSPYKDRVCLLHGDSTILKTEYATMSRAEFDIKKAEQYDILVTCPGFYPPNGLDYYSTISYVTDKLRWRLDWKDKGVDILVVREAWNLLRSRMIAGEAKDILEAQYQMIDLLNEAYHVGVAMTIDSLRPKGVEITLREENTYSILKPMGKIPIPREYWYFLKYVSPGWLRRMSKSEFLIHTDRDFIGRGVNTKVPWHVDRGEDILNKLGIDVEYTKPVESAAEEGKALKRKMVSPDIHKQILDLHALKYSNRRAAAKLGLNEPTIALEILSHEEGSCSCEKNGVNKA
jgi:hypothetical protein